MKHGWEIKKLGEVCEIINGFAFKSQLFKDCGDDILRISNIQNGVIDDRDIAHFSKDDYPKVDFDKYTVFPNDIVVALSGATTGKFGINNTDRKLYLNQRVAICREKTNDINHRFLLHFLKIQSKSFLESAAGVAQPNLSTEQIKLYEIPIPPLSEQEKIVAELDCLSGIIEKKKQQLKEFDSLAQSIFYEMFGNPIDNEKGWEVKTIGDVCLSKQTIKRANKHFNKEDKIQYIDIASINNSTNIIEGTTPYVFGVAPSRAQQVVNYGDILVSLVRPNLKNIAVIQYMNDSLVASSGFCVLRVGESINEMYLRQVVLSDSFTIYLMNRVSGANYPAVREEDIKRCKIGIPPLALQQEFTLKIEVIGKQKALIKQSIAEVEALFNSRMDYYFS